MRRLPAGWRRRAAGLLRPRWRRPSAGAPLASPVKRLRSAAEPTTAVMTDAYKPRAELLAQALDRVAVSTLSNAPSAYVASVLEAPEDRPWPRAGTVPCLIRSLEASPAALRVDRIQVFMGPSAEKEAARDGALPPPDGVYVRNRDREDVLVPLDDDFVFVTYAESVPEGIPVISPQGRFPIVVLSRAEFIAQYPRWLDELLEGTGVVLTIDDGAAVFAHGNYAP